MRGNKRFFFITFDVDFDFLNKACGMWPAESYLCCCYGSNTHVTTLPRVRVMEECFLLLILWLQNAIFQIPELLFVNIHDLYLANKAVLWPSLKCFVT